MPAGALWTLRYNPNVDGRILARSDAVRLRADEFVQNVAITSTRNECLVAVQFRDDQDGPSDYRLRSEIESWLVLPEPPREEPNAPLLSRDELISLAIGTPIQRRAVPQFSNPIRRNRDYTAVARRTFLVQDLPDSMSYAVLNPPYDSSVMSNDQVGDAVSNNLAEMTRRVAQGLILPTDLVTGVPQEVPGWLKAGVWVTSKSEYAKVTKVEGTSGVGVRVSLKLWRVQEVRTFLLGVFLSFWTQCEKPADPPSRYERILRNLR